MSDAYGPATYGDDFADVYDDWYGELSDPQATAEVVAELVGIGLAGTELAGTGRAEPGRAGAGRVLELGVGTGRLALAIAAKGIAIDGIDSSAAMLQRLADKDPQGKVGRILGDFGTEDFGAAAGPEHAPAAGLSVAPEPAPAPELAPGPYRVVFAAYNTFFNLASEQAQLRCLRSVARRLEPGGALLIEAFLPAEAATNTSATEAATNTSTTASVRASRPDDQPSEALAPEALAPEALAGWPQVEARRHGQSLLLNVSVQDAQQQIVRGRHIEVRLTAEDIASLADTTSLADTASLADASALASIVSVRSWQIRYLSPSQLDELAKQAGFELTQRWSDWHRSPFDVTANQHVSVYQLTAPPA